MKHRVLAKKPFTVEYLISGRSIVVEYDEELDDSDIKSNYSKIMLIVLRTIGSDKDISEPVQLSRMAVTLEGGHIIFSDGYDLIFIL